jgi:ADP-dependent NAD(P)H-hydrate dehydratase / NAD(P)H-hydrate epimerase
MKILSAAAIREWDQYTIEHEPVLSIELMERAAGKCTEWIMRQYPDAAGFSVFCGKGNNGGDGLAMARMLLENNYTVTVYILEFGHKGTADFQINLARLHKLPKADIHFIQEAAHFHPFAEGEVVIDALPLHWHSISTNQGARLFPLIFPADYSPIPPPGVPLQ